MEKQMIVGVQGTSSFNDYQVFLRAMAVAMSHLEDGDQYFYVYSAGPSNVNAMVSEFVNLSERGMKSRGKKIKMYKVAPSWISENMKDVKYFAFLSNEKEHVSKLVNEAETNNVDFGIFRY
jgi:hypothetical protein